jgi:predicted O-methyltransferase YrrM
MDEETAALHEYNELVTDNPNLDNVLLPVRDGLMIARKIA